ncbi:MAG: HflX-like GTP-binding protein [Candidatus Kariarchaeaceae archaeon]
MIRHIKRKWIKPNKEIFDLAGAAGYQIVDEILFYGDQHPKNFLPEMKLQDLIFIIDENDIQKIIIEGLIRPAQMQSLEELTELEIIDKTMLVLEIFSNKANTKDIQLQIQLAQLKYSIPRTRTMLGDAVRKERPGFGGSGEQVTDIFVSDMKRRIRRMENRLEKYKNIQQEEETLLNPIIPIVGYYSTGKSTLFNILTENSRSTGPEAFTTMILKTSRSFLTGYAIDLIDTIGLVDLPSDVLNAFDLMLSQIFSFSGMILCLDSSLPVDHWQEQLEELGSYYVNFTKFSQPKVIIVFSKIDLVKNGSINEMKNLLSQQEWLTSYRLLETDMHQPDKIKKDFVKIFEEFFQDDLLLFDFNDISPSYASKIHDVARVESQEWLVNGNTSISAFAPKNVIKKLRGEIFQ